MIRRLGYLMLFISLVFGYQMGQADEGMWLLNQLKILPWQELQQRGLQLSPKDIEAMKDAVVIIDGGTGEFVSPKGLVLTNHHVAFAAIQRASTPEKNYVEEGFLATTMAEEIPIPGYDVRITKYYKDVTDRVLEVVTEEMTPLERFNAIERRKNEIEDEAEKEGEGLEASVVEMFSGMKYYLFVYERYKDVRLVYAPPRSIGEYGGDIDNWMWPRHTGDFSFFRVYAGKDGKPAEYSPENIPFTPKKYFPISAAPLKESDFTFILGFPGRTYRYRTSHSIAYHEFINYPFQIKMMSMITGILEEEGKKDPEVALKVSSLLKSLNNVIKNNQGMLDGFKKLRLLEKKKQWEQEFLTFLDKNPDLKKKYGNILDEIGKQYEELNRTAEKRNWLRSLRFASLPYTVYQAYRYAQEKEKPEDERDPQFAEKNIQRYLEYMKVQAKQFVPQVDRRIFIALMQKMAELPADQQPEFLKDILQGKSGEEAAQAIEQFADRLYAGSSIKTLEDALNLYSLSLGDIQKQKDPLIAFAEKLSRELIPLEQKDKEFNGAITKLRADYMRALFAWKGEKLYPDANRTLRFTYGDVRGYSPRDAVLYLPKTSLRGVVEKNTGEEPFNAPEKLLELWQKRDFGNFVDAELQDVPVNFLHTTDITGGNSGSPVLNGKGHLIGVAFDGNYEAMTSDYQFDLNITRTISVDSRYVLFILEKFAGARNLLNELEIVYPSMTGK